MLYALLDQDGQLRVSMTYRQSRVLPAIAAQLVEYFQLAISTIMKQPNAALGSLNLLSSRDRQRLSCWNEPLPYPQSVCVHELIQKKAMEQPSRLAISGYDGEFTYEELDQLASELALSLVSRGDIAAQCIPLCFEKSRWTVVAMLAVMKAGRTFVPLDPDQPVARLFDICRRTNSKLVLTSPAQVNLARSLSDDVMEVGEHITNSTSHIAPSNVDPEQPAYILFTSGSTGEPKGAMISHSSYCYAAQSHIRALSLDNTSRVLQISSYAFDVSVMEILSTLIAGATVCVISESEKSQMMMDGHCPFPVTHAVLTPSIARALDATKASWVKNLVLLGEPVSASHITQWGQACHLLNTYGPTECAVLNTVSPRLVNEREDDHRNIGWGINVNCWIVNPHDHNKLLPVGAVGELIMSGPAVGQGYLGDPEKTAEAFIEEPAWLRHLYPEGPRWRFYKTGDLFRYEISDGSLRFEGRKDRQIKIRGQRVELEDVEHHIRHCFPGVKEAVVEQVMIPDGQRSEPSITAPSAVVQRLIACVWICLDTGETITNGNHDNSHAIELLQAPSSDFHSAAAGTLAKLREALPGYMVPDVFVPINKVPRTVTGKLDRTRLREHICAMTPEDWHTYFAAQKGKRRPMETETASKLHAILIRLLDLPPEEVGADDSFFHLGGDSILAMKMAASAKTEGMVISSHDILRYPTISEWANIVDAHQSTTSDLEPYTPFSLITDAERTSVISSPHFTQEYPFTTDNVEDIVPVTETQRFYITHSSPVSMAELFPSGLDIDRLRMACSKVISHHSILRTIFAAINDHYLQVILREAEPLFDVVEYEDTEAYMTQESRQKLAPYTPLWSLPVGFTVVTSPTCQKVVFVLRISHAQYDGSSLPILWQSIVAAYSGYVLPRTMEFKDVVYHRLGSDHEEAFSFWREYLQDASAAALDPLKITTIPPPLNEKNPTTVRREISELCVLPNVTLATLVKAAMAWLLSQHSSSSDIILGQVVHGRGDSIPDIDKALGPCINFLPIRIQINYEWTVADFLGHVQAQQLMTVPYDFVSLTDIAQRCNTDWPDNVKFGCVIHHQGSQTAEPIEFDGIRSSGSLSWANSKPTAGQIGVISIERGSSLDLFMTGPADSMDQSTADLFGDKLAETIRLFSSSPNCHLALLCNAQGAQISADSKVSSLGVSSSVAIKN